MRTSFDDLDMTAFVVFAILLSSLTTRALMIYKRTFKFEPLIQNPVILLVSVLTIVIVTLVSSRAYRITITAGLILFFGVYSRAIYVFDPATWSDVLPVTEEAVQVVLSGGNIYTHTYRFSVPPGQPFKYGPFEPIFYVPFYLVFGDLRIAELVSSTLIMTLILILGRFTSYEKTLIPLAIFSSWGLNITSTGAGVNDDTAGMLAFLSVFLLIYAKRRRSVLLGVTSSVFLGLSICFKLFPALLAPFIIFLLFNLKEEVPVDWKLYLAALAATLLLFSLPYLLISPEPYLKNLFSANVDRIVELGLMSYQWHIWYSVLNRDFFLYLPTLLSMDVITLIFMIPKIMLAVSVATMVVLLVLTKGVTSLARIISYGVISWFALLIPGPWFPGSFFGFIAPFICTLPILDLAWSDRAAPQLRCDVS
ncbi:MAG: hypothetical protein QXK96_00200 [Candidatus Bathyarchaeia archaeon]